MKIFKTQFEVRFSPILEFTPAYRKMIAPYLDLGEFTITNQNTFQEGIVMNFKDANYGYELRWDKLAFACEGDRDDLRKAQGPFFLFFEILEKVKTLPSFGKIKSAVLQESSLQVIDKDLDTIKADFAKAFYTTKVPLKSGDLNPDYAIVLSHRNEQNELKFTFGPFDYTVDVDMYNLSPIKKSPKENYKNFNGIYCDSICFQALKDVNHGTYKTFNEKIVDFRNKIKIG